MSGEEKKQDRPRKLRSGPYMQARKISGSTKKRREKTYIHQSVLNLVVV